MIKTPKLFLRQWLLLSRLVEKRGLKLPESSERLVFKNHHHRRTLPCFINSRIKRDTARGAGWCGDREWLWIYPLTEATFSTGSRPDRRDSFGSFGGSGNQAVANEYSIARMIYSETSMSVGRARAIEKKWKIERSFREIDASESIWVTKHETHYFFALAATCRFSFFPSDGLSASLLNRVCLMNVDARLWMIIRVLDYVHVRSVSCHSRYMYIRLFRE